MRRKRPAWLNQTGRSARSRRRRTLPPGCPGSTIRAVELNGRVRDGNGCSLYAIVASKELPRSRECESLAVTAAHLLRMRFRRKCGLGECRQEKESVKPHGRLVRLG